MEKLKKKKSKNQKREQEKEPKSSSILETINPSFEFVDFMLMTYIAYQYLILWINPGKEDAETIFQFAGLMGFEFIMVHSGVFMAAMPKKVSLLVFVPAYGLFAWAFNEIIGGNNLIFYIYLGAVFNRMRFAFFNVSEELKDKQILKSALSAMLWFFLAILVSFGNFLIPDFGLSAENLTKIGYYESQTRGGLFLDIPKTAICLGFLYYLILAISASPLRFNWLYKILLRLAMKI